MRAERQTESGSEREGQIDRTRECKKDGARDRLFVPLPPFVEHHQHLASLLVYRIGERRARKRRKKSNCFVACCNRST